MQESDIRTAEVKTFKETDAEAGEGLDPHTYVWWMDADADHPYWVIDYLEAGGWMQHLPEPEEGGSIEGITVHYNPEERNDIQKVVLPDGTEIEAGDR